MASRRRYYTIAVKMTTAEKLLDLKKKHSFKTMDELISKLVSVFHEHTESARHSRVKKVLCSDLLESKASLQGWVKLLQKKLPSDDIITAITSYLVPDTNDKEILLVNKSKCT